MTQLLWWSALMWHDIAWFWNCSKLVWTSHQTKAIKNWSSESMHVCSKLYNGKSFKAAAGFLKRVFKDQTVIDHLSAVGTEWVFNVEKAPWWGGVFERLVKSTKRCLRKFIGQAKFSLDELHTAVVEVEFIINSRPLTYLSSGDLEEPLTPHCRETFSQSTGWPRLLCWPGRWWFHHQPGPPVIKVLCTDETYSEFLYPPLQ